MTALKDPSILFDAQRFAKFSGNDHTLGDLGEVKNGTRTVYIWPPSITGWVEVDGKVGRVFTDTGDVGLPSPVAQDEFLREVQRAQEHTLDITMKVRAELVQGLLLRESEAREDDPVETFTWPTKLTDKIGGGGSN